MNYWEECIYVEVDRLSNKLKDELKDEMEKEKDHCKECREEIESLRNLVSRLRLELSELRSDVIG